MRPTTAKLALLCLVFPAFRAAHAQTMPALEQYNDLALSASLERPGLRPWHLIMSFQLYDLIGKKSETGTIEEWWVSPQNHRLVITSPSYNLTEPEEDYTSASNNKKSDYGGREAYLVQYLLSQFLSPIPSYRDVDKIAVTRQSIKVQKSHLSCLIVSTLNNSDSQMSTTPKSVFCTNPNSLMLRLHEDVPDGPTVTRNQPATFENTQLALSNQVYFYGKLAIEGNVTKLETFDPLKNPVKLQAVSQRPLLIPSAVIAGAAIKKNVPIYPMSAKIQNRSGTVILCVIISKQGKITSLEVVSTPSKDFTDSALDAVKTWTYQPYLLDGKPTEVSTTITVHYAMN